MKMKSNGWSAASASSGSRPVRGGICGGANAVKNSSEDVREIRHWGADIWAIPPVLPFDNWTLSGLWARHEEEKDTSRSPLLTAKQKRVAAADTSVFDPMRKCRDSPLNSLSTSRLSRREGHRLAISILTFQVSLCYLSEQLQARRSRHMPKDQVDRRLAAIFAGDIAGYSRLMGADEEGTLRQLKAHRKELVDPKITEHRGRIVKTTGDGMLVEFVSVVDVVRCAVDIQRGMAERNAGVPSDERIEFRIGI
jgi:hypothetical protein